MNAASRLVHQNILSRPFVYAIVLTRQQIALLGLALAILASAMSIIYVTHVAREYHANYQHNLALQEQLQVERGQLLLERGAWMMQARVEQIAEEKLGMIVPTAKSSVIIHE